MKQNLFLMCLLLVFSGYSSFAQDTIVATNGDTIVANKVEIDLEMRELQYINEKGKYSFIDFDDVYHIKQDNGKLFKYYKQNKEVGNFYTYEQMGDYIEGLAYAKDNYTARGALILGIGVGAISAPLIGEVGLKPYFIPLLPFSFAVAKGLIEPECKNLDKTAYSEEFLYGYKDKVKAKRFNNAIIGGVASCIVSSALYIGLKQK